ncbi:hypothetical protein LTS18_008600 [Coniosporium uncinatum]|uniref:Uncharacterized protein n=1 Tax=Coniosporium uncinatum TaxID=93489 RepID=A0ACC3DX31_9PEZI|nr:hypothetical protein LTS18_008600 [Coniosporium uncinatum]
MVAPEEAFLSVLQVGVAKVAVCSQHGGCYTQDNIDRHLAEQHKVKRKKRAQLIAELHSKGLAVSKENVQQPPDGNGALRGLAILTGYQCRVPSCGAISTNRGEIKKHCRAIHKWKSGPRGRNAKKRSSQGGEQLTEEPYEEVKVQTLWTEKKYISYFVVREPRGD